VQQYAQRHQQGYFVLFHEYEMKNCELLLYSGQRNSTPAMNFFSAG
jgi:hypothetical protein